MIKIRPVWLNGPTACRQQWFHRSCCLTTATIRCHQFEEVFLFGRCSKCGKKSYISSDLWNMIYYKLLKTCYRISMESLISDWKFNGSEINCVIWSQLTCPPMFHLHFVSQSVQDFSLLLGRQRLCRYPWGVVMNLNLLPIFD